jgi:hypothetical protein
MVEPKVPPTSPDLNPCDYLWRRVYSQPINSVEELTERVVAASAQIREDREVFSMACIKDNICSIYCEYSTLKVKVLCTRTFFLRNSVPVLNFLCCNRFRCGFFTISLSFVFHWRRPRAGIK